MDTVQVVIEGVNVLDDPAFRDQLIAALVEAMNDRDVIIHRPKSKPEFTFIASDTKDIPPTKIAIDPFKDLGPRHL